jgi:predicted ATPase/class 3 adenylate cyclase
MPRTLYACLMLDVEGSTPLQRRHGSEMTVALRRLEQIVAGAAADCGGFAKPSAGDGHTAFFSAASAGLHAAQQVMCAVNAENWRIPGAVFRVRGALHAGEAEAIADPEGTVVDYLGAEVNFTARLMALGHGGQILLSDAAKTLCEFDPPEGITFHDCGLPTIRDFEDRTVRVWRAIFSHVPDNPASLRNPEQSRLPRLFPVFIGRERELQDVSRLLTDSPIVSIVGTGGEGKTRLAVRVAELRESDYEQGAVFADFTRLPENSPHVARLVAESLGLRLSSEQTVQASDEQQATAEVCRFLRDRTQILVLDNCEHVPAVSPLVEAILDRCRSISLLATSRCPLGVHGEKTYELPPLPPPAENASLEEQKQNPAVRLFMASAPSRDWSAQAVGKIAALCRQLDGTALAIEIAAAQCEFYTLDELQTELKNRLPDMTSGTGGRHDSIVATLRTSYDRLSSAAQDLFRRLAILFGKTPRSSLFAVCGSEQPSPALTPALRELVHHRLVIADTQAEGETPFFLREPVRQYAFSLLSEQEISDLRLRHLQHFAHFAQEQEARMRTAEHLIAKQAMSRAQDNINAALEYQADSILCLQLAAAIVRYWKDNNPQEGVARLRQALDKAPTASPVLQANAWNGMGDLLMRQSKLKEARACIKRSLALLQQDSDTYQIARALMLSGYIESYDEHYAVAQRDLKKSLRLAEQMGDDFLQATCHNALGDMAYCRKEHDKAIEQYRRSLALFRNTGSTFQQSQVSCNLAMLEQAQGFHESAIAHFREAIALFDAFGSQHLVAINSNNLAVSLQREHLFSEAGETALYSLRLNQQLGDARGSLYPLMTLCSIGIEAGRSSHAAQILGILQQREAEARQSLPTYTQNDLADMTDQLNSKLGAKELARHVQNGRTKTANDALIFLEDFVTLLSDSVATQEA